MELVGGVPQKADGLILEISAKYPPYYKTSEREKWERINGKLPGRFGVSDLTSSFTGINRNVIDANGLMKTLPASVPAIDHIGNALEPALRVEPQAANILLGTPPTTQSLTLGLGAFTLQVFGAGTAVSSAGTATITGAGTASDGTPNTFTVTVAGTVTITITTATVVWLVPGSIPSSYFAGAASAITGSVTQANMRLSAVNGTAFVDFSAGTNLTGNLGKYLRVTDSAGKSVYGFIKAAGTGETYGAETNTDVGFDTPALWAPEAPEWEVTGGKAVATAVASGKYLWLVTPPAAVVLGLFKSVMDVVITSGGISFRIWSIDNGPPGYTTNGTKTLYWVPTATSVAFGVKNHAVTTGTADNLSNKQVLTPSATGVTIVSTPGGATYNWASQDTGFNYNDSSGYTYTILGTVRLSEANTTTLGIPTAVSNALAASGTIVIKGRFAFARAAGVVTGILTSDATNKLIYTTTAAGNVSADDGTTVAENTGAYTANTDWKIALKWPSDTNKYRIGIDVAGAGIVWGTEVAFDGSFATGANLILGHILHGTTWIYWIDIYNNVLTDAQINAIK